ncbi:MAG: hypothetical protein AAF489_08435 [Bacteroidota bacterium]
MIKRIFIYLSIGFFVTFGQAMIETYPWVKFQIKYQACTMDMEKIYRMESISEITGHLTMEDRQAVEVFRQDICLKNKPIKKNRHELTN